MNNDVVIPSTRAFEPVRSARQQEGPKEGREAAAGREKSGAERSKARNVDAPSKAASGGAKDVTHGANEEAKSFTDHVDDVDLANAEAQSHAVAHVLDGQQPQALPALAGVTQLNGFLLQLAQQAESGDLNAAESLEAALVGSKPVRMGSSLPLEEPQYHGAENAVSIEAELVMARSAIPSAPGGAEVPGADAFQLNVSRADGTQISIDRLRRETNFASPVTVLLNEQRTFQPLQTVTARVAMMTLLSAEGRGELPSATESRGELQSADETAVSSALPDATGAASADPRDERSLRSQQRSAVRERADGQDESNSTVKQATNVAAGEAPAAAEGTQALSPPTQQVRAAIRDGMGGALPAPATDYASLFADRQTPVSPMVRTLHLALSPQGLGHVEIRMNLAGNDLMLDIEATRAETARLISADRNELGRDLSLDGVELSSLTVSVREASVNAAGASEAGGGTSADGFDRGGQSDLANMNAQRDQRGDRRESRSPGLAVSVDSITDTVESTTSVAGRSALYI